MNDVRCIRCWRQAGGVRRPKARSPWPFPVIGGIRSGTFVLCYRSSHNFDDVNFRPHERSPISGGRDSNRWTATNGRAARARGMRQARREPAKTFLATLSRAHALNAVLGGRGC